MFNLICIRYCINRRLSFAKENKTLYFAVTSGGHNLATLANEKKKAKQNKKISKEKKKRKKEKKKNRTR